MKIKVGDLTVKQVHSICHQVACEDCPLHCGHGYKIACMTGYTDFDNEEVEIPDELLDNDKKEDIWRKNNDSNDIS